MSNTPNQPSFVAVFDDNGVRSLHRYATLDEARAFRSGIAAGTRMWSLHVPFTSDGIEELAHQLQDLDKAIERCKLYALPYKGWPEELVAQMDRTS